MSAFGGILTRDKQPVDERMYRRMRQSLAGFGDGVEESTGPGFAICAARRPFDLLSNEEHQPLKLSPVEVLTFTGRLDNREDLLVRLGRADVRTDLDIVAQAYAHNRESCFGSFVGDWAIVVVNTVEREVIIATDHMANRPVFYVVTDRMIVWCTALDVLVEACGRSDDIDDEYIARVLTFGVCDSRTAFRGVHRADSASVIHLKSGEVPRKSVSWKLRPDTIRYRRLEDYADRLRELLTESVRVRLRANAPVWAELSGGLDSSTIVCLSARLIAAGVVAAPSVHPLSRVFSGSPESDESHFIQQVEQWSGLRSLRIDDGDVPWETYNAGVLPDNLGREDYIVLDAMRATRSRVLLSGELGDVVMGQSSQHFVGAFDHLQNWHMTKFAQECMEWARQQKRPVLSAVWQLARLLTPPKRLSRQFEREAVRLRRGAGRTREARIASAFALQDDLVRRTQPTPFDPAEEMKGWPPQKWPFLNQLSSFVYCGGCRCRDADIETTRSYPFSHRPLLQYVASIPTSVFWHSGTRRALMRSALRTSIPDAIVRRRSKGFAAPATTRFARMLALEVVNRVDTLEVVQRGWVDPDRFRTQLAGLLSGASTRAVVIRNICVIEAWLEHRKHGEQSGAGPAKASM